MATSAKCNPIIHIETEFRVFTVGFDMMNFKTNILTESISYSTALACIIISHKDSFSKSQIFRRLIFLVSLFRNTTFPIPMIGSTWTALFIVTLLSWSRAAPENPIPFQGFSCLLNRIERPFLASISFRDFLSGFGA